MSSLDKNQADKTICGLGPEVQNHLEQALVQLGNTLEWTSALETGVGIIDDQHRRLFDIFAKFAALLKKANLGRQDVMDMAAEEIRRLPSQPR